MNEREIEQVDDFIEDLLHERKPRAYRQGDVDLQMEKMYESIRAVKRLKANGAAKRRPFNSRWIRGLVALAAALLLTAWLLNLPLHREDNIVHAVVRAYTELQSYSGLVEIRSERNGELEYREIIDIKYKKPFKYIASHSGDGGPETQYLSDGERLAVIRAGGKVTVDNIFPEKELWRYHIGRSVRELDYAAEVNTLGTEILFGREAVILEYRYAGNDLYHQMWIDKDTKLPLRKVLNLPEGAKLVVEFKELQVNLELGDDIFAWRLPPGVAIRELNRIADIEEIKRAWPEIIRLLNVLPEGLELKRAGLLYEDLYEYVLRFQGLDENDYLDIYYTTDSPRFSFLFRPEIELGRLAGGYVDYDAHAWNVSGRQEENPVARWIGDESDLFIVGSPNHEVSELLSILERLKGEKIEYGPPMGENTMELYYMEVTDTAFKLGKENKSFEKPPEARELLEELLKGPQDESLSRIIPEGTKLLDLRVENGVAYVDFSAEIAKGNYGAESESVLLESIVWTMTQLEGVEAVQLLVEGEIVDSLGGHCTAGIPLTR